MPLPDVLQKNKNWLIGFGVLGIFLLLVVSLGSGVLQTTALVLLILLFLGVSCYIVFQVMRAIN